MDRTPYYVVGGGISAIMTALRMQHAGYQVVLITDQPDPRNGNQVNLRENFDKESQALTEKGATMGGGPTRMVTGTEADIYNGDSPMYDMTTCYDRTVCEGGWLDRPLDKYPAHVQKWVAERNLFDDEPEFVDAARDWYHHANIHGMEGWYKMFDRFPELMGDADNPDDPDGYKYIYFARGIDRTYDTGDQRNAAVRNYTSLRFFDRPVLDRVEDTETDESEQSFKAAYPHLKSDHVAGAITMEGCVFDVQRFVMNALDYMQNHPDNPVKKEDLRFSTALTEIVKQRNTGKVRKLVLQKGGEEIEEIPDPQYVSLHLGAYDRHKVLNNTPAKDKIMGVAGFWAWIPRPEGMDRPMKIHFNASKINGKDFPLIDLNLIPHGDKIMVGFGYNLLGDDPTNISEESRQRTLEGGLLALKAVLKEEDFDPEKDFHVIPGRHCTRSITRDGLPLIETMETTGNGRLTIYGGDMTGTTSIAPAAAELIHAVTLGITPRTPQARKLLQGHRALKTRANEIIDPPDAGQKPSVPVDDNLPPGVEVDSRATQTFLNSRSAGGNGNKGPSNGDLKASAGETWDAQTPQPLIRARRITGGGGGIGRPGGFSSSRRRNHRPSMAGVWKGVGSGGLVVTRKRHANLPDLMDTDEFDFGPDFL